MSDETTTPDETAPEKVDTIYVDYVCPSHGTIHTVNVADETDGIAPVEVLCLKTSGEGEDLQLCTQAARWRSRRGEMASVAHPSGGEAPGVQPPPA